MIDERVLRARHEYETSGLLESDLAADPFIQFESWYAEVDDVGVEQANAFVLSTADSEGRPSARAVLMKGFSDRGLVFYSNSESRKGHDLRANPRAAATFVWTSVHRQVRIEGGVAAVSDSEVDEYFRTRPRGARIAATISTQSSVIDSRSALEAQFAKLDEQAGDDLPRPRQWAGWRLQPYSVEFWQGRRNRLHDRLRYRRVDGLWVVERLAP